MAYYSDTLQDGNARPLPGIASYVYAADGTLAALTLSSIAIDNPVYSDGMGMIEFEVPAGRYAIEYRYGGQVRRKDSVLIGVPSAAIPNIAVPPTAADYNALLAVLRANGLIAP